MLVFCFFYGDGDHRDLHVWTHSFPTRRSSDLSAQVHGAIAAGCPSDAQSRVSGGSKRASVGLRSSKLRASDWARRWAAMDRSEEHTSELQSLMRISYAVFCLKQKQTT